MKRIFSIFLTLCLLLCLSVSVFAADTSRSYTFDLTANGAHEVSVKTGDVITVTLELKRMDSGSGFTRIPGFTMPFALWQASCHVLSNISASA